MVQGTTTADAARCPVSRPAEAAQRLPPALRRRLQPLADPGTGAVRGLAAPGDTPTLHSLLRNAADEGLRRAAWEACYQTPASNLAVLDGLVEVSMLCMLCMLWSA